MSDKPRKTAQEKAQEALDAAERKVTSLTERKAKAQAQVAALNVDLNAAIANRDYVKQHPALTQTNPPEVGSEEPQAAVPEEPAQPTLGGAPF